MAPTKTDPEEELARLRRRQAAFDDLILKVKAIKALSLTVHNSSETVEKLAAEHYYAVWDILSGRPPKNLELKQINKEDFLRELKDG